MIMTRCIVNWLFDVMRCFEIQLKKETEAA